MAQNLNQMLVAFALGSASSWKQLHTDGTGRRQIAMQNPIIRTKAVDADSQTLIASSSIFSEFKIDTEILKSSNYESQVYWVTAMEAARRAQSTVLLNTTASHSALSKKINVIDEVLMKIQSSKHWLGASGIVGLKIKLQLQPRQEIAKSPINDIAKLPITNLTNRRNRQPMAPKSLITKIDDR